MGFPLRGRGRALLAQGARREVSRRLCRTDCHRQSVPTTTASGYRGFEFCHANKPKAQRLNRRGIFGSRVVNGSRTRRDSAIIFCGIKNRNIDISIFLFCHYCKKCHFWQFIAPFGSQLRQMAFECLVSE